MAGTEQVAMYYAEKITEAVTKGLTFGVTTASTEQVPMSYADKITEAVKAGLKFGRN